MGPIHGLVAQVALVLSVLTAISDQADRPTVQLEELDAGEAP